MYLREQKGLSMVEVMIAAGLWILMMAGVSQVLINSTKQQVLSEAQDVGDLLGVTLGRYYTNPDNCKSSLDNMALSFTTQTPLTIPNFPFKTLAGDTITLAVGSTLLGGQLKVTGLDIKLKYALLTATDSRAVPVWHNQKAVTRNSAIITINYDLIVGTIPKKGLFKSVEVPVLMDPSTSKVNACAAEANSNISDACGVIFSQQQTGTTNCVPVKVEFKGAYHTRETIGAPPVSPCPVPIVKTPDTTQPGYCAAGLYWSKDLPSPATPQCIPQGTCAPGKGTYLGSCYPVCLPQGTCPAGQGVYMGSCTPTSCPDQETYTCTCPTTGAAIDCGQPPVPAPPCADPNVQSVDAASGAYICSCPAGSATFVTGSHDWTQTTSVICGWSGYGKKVGPTYCPVNTSKRDTYYVCIKY